MDQYIYIICTFYELNCVTQECYCHLRRTHQINISESCETCAERVFYIEKKMRRT